MVPVSGVEISRIAPFVFGAITNLTVDVTMSVIDFDWEYSDIEGSDLWKIGMWASANSDGIGTKIGFVSQVIEIVIDFTKRALTLVYIRYFWIHVH